MTPKYKFEVLHALLGRVSLYVNIDPMLFHYLDDREWDDVVSVKFNVEVSNNHRISQADKELWMQLGLHGAEVV